ncbi:MAG: hypothetical protein VB099_16495 [Candidatus Limiplasma sp.]|nr:hypothetical protein [Candidatus Limiplasma sp.]
MFTESDVQRLVDRIFVKSDKVPEGLPVTQEELRVVIGKAVHEVLASQDFEKHIGEIIADAMRR